MENPFNLPEDMEYKDAAIIIETKGKEKEIWVLASAGGRDLNGDNLDPKGADTSYFEKYGPMFYNHNYSKWEDLIAKKGEMRVDEKGLWVKPVFADHPAAQEIKKLVKDGFIQGASVGWKPKEFSWNKAGGRDCKSWSVFEVSFTPIPMNPRSMISYQSMNKQDGFRKAIPYEMTGRAEEAEAWDAMLSTKSSTPDMLYKQCAWHDSKQADLRESYKLAHHNAEGKAVWLGVHAAMKALMEIKAGGIPSADRKAVYDHLAKHYGEFGKEVPEFKEMEEILRDEVELLGKRIDEMQALVDEASGAILAHKTEAEEPDPDPEPEPDEKKLDLTASREAVKMELKKLMKDEMAEAFGGIKKPKGGN